jgi:SAM-dependent methyltransferase
MFLYLQRRVPSFGGAGAHALHVAPEACLAPALRERFGDGYVSADFRDPKADVPIDIMNIEFPDETFDFIYCSHVLEHVEDDRKAMREFRRVLKKDGIAVLLVPIMQPARTYEDATITDPRARARAFGQRDHVRVYGPDYVERLEDAGFAVDVVRVDDLATAEEAVSMSLTTGAGVIHACRRRPE